MDPREVEQILREVLEAVVALVATLGELVATVTAPGRDVWPLLYPESLHADLREFIWTLRDTLDHDDVTSLGQRGVTSLSQAMATLKATPGATLASVKAVVRAWWELMEALNKRWARLRNKVKKILGSFEDEDTDGDIDDDTDDDTDEDTDDDTDEDDDEDNDEDNDEDTNEDTDEDTAEDIATGWAEDLWNETPPNWGTAGDNLVSAGQQPSVAPASVVAAHESPVVAATKVREEAVVATRQVGAATRRQRVKEAQRLLRCLKGACRKAWVIPAVMEDLGRPWDSEDSQEETEEEESSDDLEYLMALVAEFERLWEASARLIKDHLLVALGEIDSLLSSPCGGSGGPGGPRGRAVAKRCQKAIEDIPRLLGGQ